MNAADLVAFLSGELSASNFDDKIRPEVERWAARLSERGRSAAIILVGSFPRVDITPEFAARFLDAYLSSMLRPASFAYVLDALLLDERFQWTNISLRNAIEHVLGTDDLANPDMHRARKVRAELTSLVANSL